MKMKRFFLIFAFVGLLTAAYERTRTDELMYNTASAFLASLSPEQTKKARFALDNPVRFDNMDERSHWLYTPFERRGLQLREMTTAQQKNVLLVVILVVLTEAVRDYSDDGGNTAARPRHVPGIKVRDR